MDKASKWFRSILGLKKPEKDSQQPIPTQQTTTRLKKRWSFVKSYREKDNFYHSQPLTKGFATHDHVLQEIHQEEPNKNVVDNQAPQDSEKHAIAVAVATAAVAEAAVAAAHAAAEVVRLTSSSGRNNSSGVMAYVSGNISSSGFQWREDLAALKIQSAFRGYLARRASRALRSLIRLQALVKGHIQRKKNLARMQAVLKVQKRARAGRLQFSESSNSGSKSSHHFQHPGPPTPEKMEHAIQTRSGKYEQSSMLKRIGSKSNGRTYGDEEKANLSCNWSERRMEERLWEHRMARSGPIDDEKSYKILEVDNGRHHFIPKRRNHSYSLHTYSDPYCHSFSNSKDSATHQTVPSLSSGEVQSFTPLKFPCEEEGAIYCTAENSPQFFTASSRGGSGRRSPFTPSRSDGSISLLSGYSDYYPNYMSYTESSKAKVRSISAPRQRPQYDRSSSTKRYSIHGFGEPRSSSAQRASAMLASFTSKAYPGSGRLDRLGMPIRQRF